MRTTLDVDDDVLAAVRERARSERRSLGKVLSDLARETLTRGPLTGGEEARHGFRPFPSRGRPVTNELIDRLREEEPE